MSCLGWAALLLADALPAGMPVPSGADLARPWRLVREADGVEVPAQHRDGRILYLRSGEGPHRIEQADPRPWPRIEARRTPDAVEIASGDRILLRYPILPVPVAPGVDPVFSRAGYLHPVHTPGGLLVTNDMPSNHLHHHGIWSAWTSAHFEGRPSNFWESKQKQGRVEVAGLDETWSGPACAGFRSRHRFVNLNAPGGPKPALDETWEVRAWLSGRALIVDLDSVQSCAGESPLLVKEYRYGGIGFRGPADWEGRQGCTFLTSEGKGRLDGHATRGTWCVVRGTVGSGEASVGLLDHPANPRHPTPMRIHPDEPFFNWAVPQAGDLLIEPGKPFRTRLRFVIADGVLDAADMETHRRAYAALP